MLHNNSNMDQSQRGATNDSSNAFSVSSNSMPNVLFREIHKNAFLKRHSSDRRTGFPRKSERVWVVFCVHDDAEPFLEIYPDQKVALTHKPDWFASLSNALHVSPTICGHEDEFEFAVTLSFQVVRLAAPSWESMMEWVETIRNKLRELKVLCPKENVYSKMPEQKQPLLPTRDPNSPLPLPPEGPSTLLPGVELVHLQPRNGTSNDGGDVIRRHQRDSHNRNNVMQERQANKTRINERDNNRSVTITSQPTEWPSSSSSSENPPESSNSEVNIVPLNLSADLQKGKPRVRRAVSVPSTSQITPGPNVTVIEVSATSSRDTHSLSEISTAVGNLENVSGGDNDCDDDDDDDDDEADNIFFTPLDGNKSDIKNCGPTSNEEEVHYEHVFLPSVPICKPQVSQVWNCSSKCSDFGLTKTSKSHATSVLINSNVSTYSTPSLSGSVPSTSTSNQSINVNGLESHIGNSACVNLNRNSVAEEVDKCDSIIPTHNQIRTKLEKVNISGFIPRVSGKSTKQGIVKSTPLTGKDSNVNVVETKKFSAEVGIISAQPHFFSESQEVCRIGSSETPGSISGEPSYSQVKKVPKLKMKSDDTRQQERNLNVNGSPIFPKGKVNEIQSPAGEPQTSHRSENSIEVNKTQIIKLPQKVGGSKNVGIVNVNVAKEGTRNSERKQSGPLGECDVESASSSASTSGNKPDNSKPSASKKETHNNCNNNSDVEPIPATVQPAVGVISVEDIPLIGGHQRRRRRSSSSDAVPCPNGPSSRVIGGADRIRINIPQTSNIVTRDDHRNEFETRPSGSSRNVTDQIVHINPTPQSSRLTLREQQVFQLKKEMLHPGGVRLQLRRKDCTGSIALVDVINGVWVAGWKQKEHPLLYNALHIGDQLISVADVVVRTSADAQKLIRSSTSLYIEFIIRRVPFGNVFALQRVTEGQNLGIVQEGNTAEIKEVLPNSIAAKQGLTSKTPSHDGLSLTTWFLTEINGRPLNLFFKDSEVKDRLNAVGKEISILVQPHDFIKQIKKQLKNIRGYKDYIVQ